MNQQKQQHGISAIFVLVMLLFMMIIGLTFLMVANLGRKNSASVGRKHAFESGESATDRIINRLKYDMIGNSSIMGDMSYILSNPTGKGNMEALNEYRTEYLGLEFINVKDRSKQFAEIMAPASDEPYDYPYSNGDRGNALANRSGMGMEDDPWLSSSRPEGVDENNDGVADYWKWRHVSDLRHVSLNPRTRIFLGYYQADLLDADGDNKTTNDKVPTGTQDANGIDLYELLPSDHSRDQRAWTQADGSHQFYMIDSGNTLDEFNPDRAPFLVNVRANSTVEERQSRDFGEHRIPDSRLDGYYDTATGERIPELWNGDTPIPESIMTQDQKDQWKSERDGVPDYQAFLPDADGDGIGDSRWMWAPLSQVRDVRYLMAVRVVDLSSKININTSTSMRKNGNAGGIDYPYATSLGDAPQFYDPSEIDSSMLLRTAFGELGGLDNAYGIMRKGRPLLIVAPLGVDPTSDRQANYSTYRQVYNNEVNQSGFDLLDELFLRHGGNITSFRDPTSLVKSIQAAPFLIVNDQNLGDAYTRLRSNLNTYDNAPWKQVMGDVVNYERNAKEALTTISGAIDLAPTLTIKDETMNQSVSKDSAGGIIDQVRLKKDLNRIFQSQSNRYDRMRALQYELKEVWKHAEEGARSPYWVQQTLGGDDNIDSWTMRMALSIKDYYDNDNVISYYNFTHAGASGTTEIMASGFERRPFMSEVMIVMPYDVDGVEQLDYTAETRYPNLAQLNAGPYDEIQYRVSVEPMSDDLGLVIEIINPFTYEIDLSTAQLAIKYGGTEEVIISDLSVTTGGAALQGDENVLIYLDTEVPDISSADPLAADQMMTTQIDGYAPATYRYALPNTDKTKFRSVLSDTNGVELKLKAFAENIKPGIDDPNTPENEAVVWLDYQSLRLTDRDNYYYATDNAGAAILSDIILFDPPVVPEADDAKKHRLYKRMHFLGSGDNWKAMILQGVNGIDASPRWRRISNTIWYESNGGGVPADGDEPKKNFPLTNSTETPWPQNPETLNDKTPAERSQWESDWNDAYTSSPESPWYYSTGDYNNSVLTSVNNGNKSYSLPVLDTEYDRFSNPRKYVVDAVDPTNKYTDVNEFFESDGTTAMKGDGDQMIWANRQSDASPAGDTITRMSEFLYVNLLGPGVSNDSGDPKTFNDIMEDHVAYWKDQVSLSDFRFDIDGDRYIKVGNDPDNEPIFRSIQVNLDGTHNDQFSYMHVPPIHMFLSRFSMRSPYRNLLNYTYSTNDQGLYDDVEMTDNSGTNQVRSNLIRHGAININTVDRELLLQIMPGFYDYNPDMIEKIVDAIIKYRENPLIGNDADDPESYYRHAPVDQGGLGLPVTWRGGRGKPADDTEAPILSGGRPGFAHLSELLIVLDRLIDEDATDRVPFHNGIDDYEISRVGGFKDYYQVQPDNDGIKDDFVERYALYGFMSEMFVTRSDFYAVYVLLRGYTFDPSAGFNQLGDLVEQKRYLYIIDRSTLMTGNNSISIRANISE